MQIDTLNTAVATATNQQIGTGIVIDGEAADLTNEILASNSRALPRQTCPKSASSAAWVPLRMAFS